MMKFDLHPACSAWPEMRPNELRDLADDIKAHGLRDEIALTRTASCSTAETGRWPARRRRRADDDDLRRQPVTDGDRGPLCHTAESERSLT